MSNAGVIDAAGKGLTYRVEPGDGKFYRMTRQQPNALGGMMIRDEGIEYYYSKNNVEVENVPFYQLFSLFHPAGIAQQIYCRYHHKQTKNPAFKNDWIFVNYLKHRSCKIIKESR